MWTESLNDDVPAMKRLLVISALVLLTVLIGWAVTRGGSAPEVHFASATTLTIESTVSTNGKVEPEQWAAARAEAGGVVRSLAVERGSNVVAGQPLVLLDQTAAQSELAAAEARQQEAQAENTIIGAGGKPGVVASLESSVQTATAAVQVAQRNYDSMLRLQEHQAATKLQVNEAKDALDRAKLQLASAQAQRRSVVTTNDRAVAQAKLNDARAAVLLARRGLSLRSVVAPLTGTVYQFDLKIGSYLQPGQEVGLVGCLDKMKVTMYVDEPDLGRVALGMPAIITWDARPGEKWQGEVTGLPTEVTALSSRTVGEVTTYVNNPGHVLLPGVSVNATIVSRLVKDALAVPKAALRNAHGETGVFQLQGKALAWTKVTAGVSDLNNVQIVSGLQPGALVADRVISPGDAELVSGMKVRVNRDR